ncbi:hypothetical protein D9M72_426650 [compost metagenome]
MCHSTAMDQKTPLGGVLPTASWIRRRWTRTSLAVTGSPDGELISPDPISSTEIPRAAQYGGTIRQKRRRMNPRPPSFSLIPCPAGESVSEKPETTIKTDTARCP